MDRWVEKLLGWAGLTPGPGTLALLGILGWLAGTLVLWALGGLVRLLLERGIRKSVNKLDDILVDRKILPALSHLLPLGFTWWVAHGLALEHPGLALVDNGAKALLVIQVFRLVNRVLAGVEDLYMRQELAKSRPIKGYVQLTQVLLWSLAGVLTFTTLTGQDPLLILSGIGALSAVLLLVFKDSLLGLVASIQLTSNQMVRIGDWIEMPKFGADGEVVEINLQSVKVRNWDMTYSTIPIYALVSDSFKNWRGMSEGGGRRIKRSIHIDLGSVRFLDERDLDRLEGLDLIRDYLREKRKDIEAEGVEDLLNRRRLTNIGTYRAWLLAYLRHHPQVNKDMTVMVRQREPGEKGLALELYCFSADKAWVNYENMQADIFDYALAMLPVFGLAAYQQPSSRDLALLAGARPPQP